MQNFRFELINSGMVVAYYRWIIKPIDEINIQNLLDDEAHSNAVDNLNECEDNKNISFNSFIRSKSISERSDEHILPFLIKPAIGCILPGNSVFIEVTFYKLFYKLICLI